VKKVLWRGTETVLLAPKACEILGVLIENAPQILSKEELMNLVWADSFVEEANLTHHISALRKALGEDKNGRKFIETIPRKGYRFVAEIKDAANSETTEIVVSERITGLLREEIEIETSIEPSVEQITRVSNFRKNELPSNHFVKIAVIAGCILLAVFGGLAVYQFIKLRRESNIPNGNLAPISYTRLIDNKSIGGTIISPDGKFAAYFQNYFNGEGGTIFLRQLETNREVVLLESADRIFGNMDFSPDDNSIVYVSVENDKMLVKKIAVEGGTPVSLTDYSAVNPTFSPDGSRIALKIPSDSRTLPGTLAVITATGGKPEKTFGVTDFEWFPSTIPIRWTADGTSLIFRRERGGAGNLWQQNLNGSPPLQLTNFTTETIYNFVYSPDKTRILLSRGLYQTNPVMIRNF
jgi:DNA-binding winged helix-turn-helix (wHTH) protein